MSEEYDLMLIFPAGRLGEDSQQFLENKASKVNQLQRARVGLGYISGESVVQFATDEDAARFLGAVDDEKRAGKPLMVLSSLPFKDLSEIDGSSFYLSGRIFRLTRKNRTSSDSPYYRRLLDIEEIEAREMKGQRRDARIGPPTLSVPAMYVNPQSIEISRDDAAAYWRAGLFAKLDFGVLPPCRGRFSEEIGYFSEQLAGTRSAIIDMLKQFVDPSGIATVLHLVALSDDPLYRDVLAEGGEIRITDDNRSPTTIQLAINTNEEDSVSFWRSQVLTQGCEGTVPSWLTEISQAICDDCRNPALGFSVTPVSVGHQAVWDVKHPPSLSDQLRETSSSGELWARLASLAAALSSPHRELLNQLVLEPSNDQYAGPNDAYANDLCEYYFWRRPYSCPVASPEWGEAYRKLLEQFANSRPLTYPEMFSRKNERGLPRLREGSPIHLTHASEEWPWTRFRWRLLLPLGSILERIATNVLDRSDTVLDHDLILGGSNES